MTSDCCTLFHCFAFDFILWNATSDIPHFSAVLVDDGIFFLRDSIHSEAV